MFTIRRIFYNKYSLEVFYNGIFFNAFNELLQNKVILSTYYRKNMILSNRIYFSMVTMLHAIYYGNNILCDREMCMTRNN